MTTTRDPLQPEQSTERFFSLSLHLLLVAGVDGRIYRCNPAWQEILGWEAEALVGSSFFELVHPDDIARTRAEASRLGAGTESKHFENRYRCRNGRYRRLAWSAIADASSGLIYAIAHDITERYQSELALRHSRQLYRSLAEVSPVGVFRTDTRGRALYVNDRWREITGLSPAHAQGEGWLYALHPEDQARIATLWQRSGAEETASHAEYRFIDKAGKVTWVLGQAEPERDAHGQVIGYIGTITDISEQKQTEQALRESETRLREAERVAALGSWELDLQSERLIWSDEVYRIFERDPARFQPTYHNVLATIHVDDRASVQASYRAALEQKSAYRIEHRIIVPDGRVKWVEERGETRYGADGTPQRSIGTVQDITEAKRHRSLLALLARRAEALLELPRIADRDDEIAFLQQGLELAEAITESAISFVHLVNPDTETIELVTWSRRTLAEYCQVSVDMHYPLKDAGLWADAVRSGAPVVCNDYENNQRKQGLPNGHAPLRRLISVPVIERERVVMIAGIGNKPADYNDTDVESMQLIANELWRLVQRGRAMEKLRLGERVLHDTAEGVAITDAAGTLISVNPAFEQITGYSAAEVLGENPRLLKSGRHHAGFYRELWDTLTQAGHWRGEIWNRRKNGEIYPQLLTISAIRDDQQQTTQYVAIFNDISQVKQAQEQLDFLARHDALTQLPNRLLFIDRLEHALQRARDESGHLAVLFIDLDRFKVVNDTLGHPIGDALLHQVARRLATRVRGSDTLARLGGDEFALLLEERADAHSVATLARQLLETLAEPLSVADGSLVITASIGISLYPNDGDDADRLIREADRAMGAAKQQGRNNFQFFTQALTEGAFERLILENALRGAVERNELRLLYQPQVELASGRLAGVEALVRWQHRELGLVSPTRFIGLAEDIGTIHALGAWVLRTACAQMKAWDADGLQVPTVAVNLSAKQLERSDFVAQVQAVLSDCDLDPARLELEVTESMLIRDPDTARAALTALKSLGAKLALDDFGTGYSSLSMLRLLPLDRLKIDQSFVRDIGRDDDDEAIVRAIIALADSLGLETVAEGVEEPGQERFLRQQHVAIGQGYSYGAPMPADALARAWGARRPTR